MTWSIIAKDDTTGQIGIAVATRFFAVGARVPFIVAGHGGIATQALVNPYYGIDGAALLRDGRHPREIVQLLTAADPGRESRQVHILDRNGQIAAHTGHDCIDWCGHLEGQGFSIAGNMLAGPQVLNETANAFLANSTLPFARRLIAAMQAGEAALWAMFEAIQGPTLVVRGAQSDLLMREILAEMVARGKQVSSVEIPDVGHAPTFVDPAQIAIARQFFLGS